MQLAFALIAGGLLTAAGPSEELEGRTIREIRIDGLKHTREQIVRRELTSRTGEPLSARALAVDVESLDRLGVFSDVTIRTSAAEHEASVDIAVRETMPYLPIISLSVTDEDGVSAGPGFRSVNLFGPARTSRRG